MVCIALTAIITVVSLSVTFLALIALTNIPTLRNDNESWAFAQLASYVVVLQIAIIAIAIALVDQLRSHISGSVLPMNWPRHGALVIVVVVIGTFALSRCVAMPFTWADPDLGGERIAEPFLQWPVLWMFILTGLIGAPFSEELLFRGFMYAGLRESPLGFWGTAIETSLVWAAWHGLALQIIAPLFCVGMVFAWVREKTGNVWPTIGALAIYNGLAALTVWISHTQTLA